MSASNGLTNDIKQKISSDDSAIETTLFINPEPLSEPSPTLPDHFPDNLIPSNKCELEMMSLINCLIKNKYDNVNCEMFQKNYYNCKKIRDGSLFKSIHLWECEYFINLDASNRKKYMERLLIEKASLLKEYDTSINKESSFIYRKRIDSDIQQITWRIDYLPKCLL